MIVECIFDGYDLIKKGVRYNVVAHSLVCGEPAYKIRGDFGDVVSYPVTSFHIIDEKVVKCPEATPTTFDEVMEEYLDIETLTSVEFTRDSINVFLDHVGYQCKDKEEATAAMKALIFLESLPSCE